MLHGAPVEQVLQYPLSCALSSRAGSRPSMPLCATGHLLSGCYSTRRAARSWHTVARISTCLCRPLGTYGHQLGRCYSVRRVCTSRVCWVLSQLPMASPLAPSMLYMTDNSASTFLGSTRQFWGFALSSTLYVS